MITLDQIKQLDQKVRKAIDKIASLKNENNMLQEKLDNYQLRIEELEVLIDTFKEDQGEIESGIIDALNQLDILEDNIDPSKEDSKVIDNLIEGDDSSEADDSNEQKSDNEIIDDPELPESNIDAVKTDSSENTESELDIF